HQVFDRVLVAEPVRTLDGVVHVPAPVVLAHVAERGRDAALRSNGVRAGRKHFGDAGGAQTRSAGADHHHVEATATRVTSASSPGCDEAGDVRAPRVVAARSDMYAFFRIGN